MLFLRTLIVPFEAYYLNSIVAKYLKSVRRVMLEEKVTGEVIIMEILRLVCEVDILTWRRLKRKAQILSQKVSHFLSGNLNPGLMTVLKGKVGGSQTKLRCILWHPWKFSANSIHLRATLSCNKVLIVQKVWPRCDMRWMVTESSNGSHKSQHKIPCLSEQLKMSYSLYWCTGQRCTDRQNDISSIKADPHVFSFKVSLICRVCYVY